MITGILQVRMASTRVEVSATTSFLVHSAYCVMRYRDGGVASSACHGGLVTRGSDAARADGRDAELGWRSTGRGHAALLASRPGSGRRGHDDAGRSGAAA